ncbi:ABC transporter ATP-binding protein [Agromyces intestinalis]|uniref:ABC transporter ATP-binding protein n=1 Tax=Agromyces intestinalis TaxID=2592652 RepID=A0A5C1YEG8_9MICO|nr:ABC transporter ATP-binding protein [Agromyces intestinalis]QEO13910.1 ABC transporter ATP-binding protein [Agromyces intestinalis]
MHAPTPTAPPRAATAVHLMQVDKAFPDGAGVIHALRSVSLTIALGSFVAVMGPSGSGKSTFLNCAAGLDVPTGGRVVIGDTDLTGLSADDLTRFRRDRIGFVFQSYNLIAHLTVAENVGLPLILGGRRPDPAWQHHLLSAVGLSGMEDRLPGELSGGQAQRAAIARALITRPEVVFADEPTGALDSNTAAHVLEVLRSTAKHLGQTLVVVTHDARVAAAADHVLFLADGQFVGHLDTPTTEQISARMIELGGR